MRGDDRRIGRDDIVQQITGAALLNFLIAAGAARRDRMNGGR